MKKQLAFVMTLLASIQARGLCDICIDVIESIDKADPSYVAQELCTFGENDSLCESVVTPVVEWIQDNVPPEEACSYICEYL